MKVYKVTGLMAIMFVFMGTVIGMDENPYGKLSIELREKIMFDAINVSDSVKMAIEKVKSLASTDAALAKKINDPQYCLKLIKTISNRFKKGDEEVAYELGTEVAKRRIELQDKLSEAISGVGRAAHPEEFYEFVSPEVNIARIKDLVENKGADVNFSNYQGRTPLYFLVSGIDAFKDNAIEIVKLFLKYGGDPEIGPPTLIIGASGTPIRFIRNHIDSLKELILNVKLSDPNADYLPRMEKKLELYETILKMFKDAIAKRK